MLALNQCYNMDCMEGMAQFPDQYFELAIVDPPYGGAGQEFKQRGSRFGGRFDQYQSGGGIDWDHAPSPEYFRELFRVSQNQIIWGGNYFGLPPNRCFLVWVKPNIPDRFSMAMAEYAWASFADNAKVIQCSSRRKGDCFHPTQKPVELYAWILQQYAKPGDKILDTHLGSGSSRIAAYEAGCDFIGFEINPTYYDAQERRFEDYKSQLSLFREPSQLSLL